MAPGIVGDSAKISPAMPCSVDEIITIRLRRPVRSDSQPDGKQAATTETV